VEHAAKAVAATHQAAAEGAGVSGRRCEWWPWPQGAVGPRGVGVVGVRAEHLLEVAFTSDE
jgi:hypothetical protein